MTEPAKTPSRQRRVHQYVFPEWDHENDQMGAASACGAWDGVQQLVAEQRQYVTCPDCLAIGNPPSREGF